MNDNLPPGVTGNEWAIKGPEERNSYEYCEECDEEKEVVVQLFGPPGSIGPPSEAEWRCPDCDTLYYVNPRDYR